MGAKIKNRAGFEVVESGVRPFGPPAPKGL